MNYRPAKEVRDLASTLIAPHHAGLMTVPVLYLFTDDRETVAGKEALANHKKVSGGELFFLARAVTADDQLRGATTGPLDTFATDPEATVYDSPEGCFLVTVWESGWRSMKPNQRLACVDHELCFPAGTFVTGPNAEAGVRRRYSGKLVTIETANRKQLTGTPNHPILTRRGWVPLSGLNTSDDVVSCLDAERVSAAMDPDEHQVEARIEDVTGALLMRLGLVPQRAEDLDSDSAHHKVDVVDADRLLLDGMVASLSKPVTEQLFVFRDRVLAGLASLSHLLLGSDRMLLACPGSMRLLGDGLSLLRVGKPGPLRLRSVPEGHPKSNEGLGDRAAVHTELIRELVGRCPGNVSFDRVLRVGEHKFSGHVYNLQTSQHWYCANSIVTHNCHLDVKQTPTGHKRVLVPHDVEEFQAVFERHGPWMDNLAAFIADAEAGQLRLDEDAANAGVGLTLETGGEDKPKRKGGKG